MASKSENLEPTKEAFIKEAWQLFSAGLNKGDKFVLLGLFVLTLPAYLLFSSDASFRGILAASFLAIVAF